MENILVSDIMTRDPVTINPDTNLLESAKKMIKKKVKIVFISDKEKFRGLVTQKDILWAIVKKSKKDLSKIKAIDISPKKITTIKPSATIEEAINKMKKLKFRRFPVIKDGNLVGLITMSDILNFHPEFYPELKEISEIREETKKLKRLEKARERVIIKDGVCGECGERGELYRVNGMLICGSCLSSM